MVTGELQSAIFSRLHARKMCCSPPCPQNLQGHQKHLQKAASFCLKTSVKCSLVGSVSKFSQYFSRQVAKHATDQLVLIAKAQNAPQGV